ncbi:hypothetical protein SpCBS45565_g03758 [Spizellomyces sp. 'palustris']|nr:hypothetical protein SpCBS45565_g03758 [Spizellomyces sp. 'palustris']
MDVNSFLRAQPWLRALDVFSEGDSSSGAEPSRFPCELLFSGLACFGLPDVKDDETGSSLLLHFAPTESRDAKAERETAVTRQRFRLFSGYYKGCRALLAEFGPDNADDQKSIPSTPTYFIIDHSSAIKLIPPKPEETRLPPSAFLVFSDVQLIFYPKTAPSWREGASLVNGAIRKMFSWLNGIDSAQKPGPILNIIDHVCLTSVPQFDETTTVEEFISARSTQWLMFLDAAHDMVCAIKYVQEPNVSGSFPPVDKLARMFTSLQTFSNAYTLAEVTEAKDQVKQRMVRVLNRDSQASPSSTSEELEHIVHDLRQSYVADALHSLYT